MPVTVTVPYARGVHESYAHEKHSYEKRSLRKKCLYEKCVMKGVMTMKTIEKDTKYMFGLESRNPFIRRVPRHLQDNFYNPRTEKVDIAICRKPRVEDEETDLDTGGFFLSFDEYEEFLYRMDFREDSRRVKINLTGDDPLEHPYLLEMLEKNKNLGIPAELTTNGELLDLSLAQALVGLVKTVTLTEWKAEKSNRNKIKLLKSVGIEVNISFPY